MNLGIIQALGGLGLFLLGMAIMTDALRSLADDQLRRFLARTVNNPVKGAVTGAVSTAILQSSSATTVAAVGFVGAGLLTFPESLGIIFGANIGTTITGWLVALVGFKLNLGQTLLPLILVGVFMQFSQRRRLKQFGMTIAGFGLIFVGISVLQEGLTGLQGRVTPDQFPPDTVTGRLLLVLIGIAITVITQSSSAGVATALAAVHTGTISLNQAAAMVIGMDVGTTATAALATIGGNVHARRTGFAHVIYNSLTGLGALLLLTPYMSAVEVMLPGVRLSEPELVLVGFHTFFNILGVLVVLPFTTRFAALLVRVFPERGNPLTIQLDRSLLSEPDVASAAVGNTLWTVAGTLLNEVRRRLMRVSAAPDDSLIREVHDAIEKCDDYLQQLAERHRGSRQVRHYAAHMHTLDHLRRIERRARDEKRLRRCRDDSILTAMCDQLLSSIDRLAHSTQPISLEDAERVHAMNHDLKGAMKKYRSRVMKDTEQGKLTSSEALTRMDTARSLRRIAYHVWRISYHLAGTEIQQTSWWDGEKTR